MTTQEALSYEQEVLLDAKRWASNTGGSIDSQCDLVTICEYYKVRIPASAAYFKSSPDRNSLVATGYHKNLYRFLDKLASVINSETEALPC